MIRIHPHCLNDVQGGLAGEIIAGTVQGMTFKVGVMYADFHGLCSFHVWGLLAMFAPAIIHAIITGTLEKDIGIEQLKQAMPLMWDEQKKMFGME